MEVISNHLMLDDELGEYGIWYQDGPNMNQFYSDIDDSFFPQYKQGSSVQSFKNTSKFSSQSTHLKHTTTLLSLETDARVPEFEASTRSLSCSSDEMVTLIGSQQHHPPKDWDVYFHKNPLVGIQSEDSVLSSSIVPDMVEAENETFQDLTELLEQEYPLTKTTSPRIIPTPSDPQVQVLNFPPGSPKMEDSQPSCSFSADLSSPGSPPHGVERYKEMRRKNNIASKNARVARRDKEKQMEERAKQLEEDNNVLRIKVRKMEALAQELKTRLIQSVTRNH